MDFHISRTHARFLVIVTRSSTAENRYVCDYVSNTTETTIRMHDSNSFVFGRPYDAIWRNQKGENKPEKNKAGNAHESAEVLKSN